MTDDLTSYDWYRSDGEHAAELPHERDPRVYPWGMFTRDGNVLASAGMFMWFSSPAELASYLREVEPTIQNVPDEDLPDLRERIEPALHDLRHGRDIDAALGALNKAQDDWSTDWWGTFDSLCDGPGDWEADLRAGFLEQTEEMEDGDARRPIRGEERWAFIEFLFDYGY